MLNKISIFLVLLLVISSVNAMTEGASFGDSVVVTANHSTNITIIPETEDVNEKENFKVKVDSEVLLKNLDNELYGDNYIEPSSETNETIENIKDELEWNWIWFGIFMVAGIVVLVGFVMYRKSQLVEEEYEEEEQPTEVYVSKEEDEPTGFIDFDI